MPVAGNSLSAFRGTQNGGYAAIGQVAATTVGTVLPGEHPPLRQLAVSRH